MYEKLRGPKRSKRYIKVNTVGSLKDIRKEDRVSSEDAEISEEDLAGLRTIMHRGLAHLNSILLRKQRHLRQAGEDAKGEEIRVQIEKLRQETCSFQACMEGIIQRMIEQ